ncbi:MAG TPA: amidohydrolase [Pyrinomonadaceae bacterium]|nr:amidohydrolase [Pyrinomonadaceae bacterium]
MKILSIMLTVLLLGLAAPQRQAVTADLILLNGNIYTVNQKMPRAEAVAVKGNRIVFVGTSAAAKPFQGPNTRVVDLHGATVVPGMTDAHYHFLGVGQREMNLNLEGITSLEDFLAKVKERVDKAKPGEWITGRGWIETFWKGQAFPTRWDLDKISPNNPIILGRSDGHGAVANSLALKAGGVTKETKDPFGGQILRDKETGEPTGMLLDNAQGLVRRYVPASAEGNDEQAAMLADQRSIGLGWTQIQDPGGSYRDVELYKKLYGEGRMKIRIYKAVYGPGPEADRLLREGPIIEAYGSHLNVRAIKVVSDGALGSRGAALLAPYSDVPEVKAADGSMKPNVGFLRVKDEELMPMLKAALQKGIQVETHAIGDYANRFTLDEYEKALKAVPKSERKIAEPRWRDEHSQIVNPADIPRFAKLGIIPSMQPSHAIGDLHFAISRLGMDRLNGAYAWNSFIKSGVIVPGGSDAPVERGEPMIEFYAAVARKDIKGYSGDGWHPEEKVSRENALKMFTIWPAYVAFEENLRGSIEVGKLADFTVLSADIMTIPEMEILKTHCVMTVIGGEIVYQASVQAAGLETDFNRLPATDLWRRSDVDDE